jgi:hypothetical protein
VRASDVRVVGVSGPATVHYSKVAGTRWSYRFTLLSLGVEMPFRRMLDRVAFGATRPGKYEIGVVKGTAHIDDSPFDVEVPDAAFSK